MDGHKRAGEKRRLSPGPSSLTIFSFLPELQLKFRAFHFCSSVRSSNRSKQIQKVHLNSTRGVKKSSTMFKLKDKERFILQNGARGTSLLLYLVKRLCVCVSEGGAEREGRRKRLHLWEGGCNLLRAVLMIREEDTLIARHPIAPSGSHCKCWQEADFTHSFIT